MGQVIAMRAIPGSGKSTLAKQLLAKAQSAGKTAIICSADDYFVELGGGTYKFDSTKMAEAFKYCFKKFFQAVRDKIDLIIVDNTNLSAWELSPYKAFAEDNDYTFSVNEVVSDPAEAFKRQEHGVPEKAHKAMSESFHKEFIPPWWEKKRFMSKTTETGEPQFEEEPEEIKESSAQIRKLFKISSQLKYTVARLIK